VDKFDDWLVSAFVTSCNVRFLVVHVTKNEDAIRLFFFDVYDAFCKVTGSPVHAYNVSVHTPGVYQRAVMAAFPLSPCFSSLPYVDAP
jgi:hypothetical protein